MPTPLIHQSTLYPPHWFTSLLYTHPLIHQSTLYPPHWFTSLPYTHPLIHRSLPCLKVFNVRFLQHKCYYTCQSYNCEYCSTLSITAAHFSFVNFFLACWYSVLVPLLDSEFEFIHDFSWFVFIDSGPVVLCRSVDICYHVLCFWQNLFHPDVTIMVGGIKNQLPVCVWTRKCFSQAMPFKMNLYVSVCVCVWLCHLKWIYM